MPAPPVGLDITSNALIAVALKRKGKGYSVATHAVAGLPHGLVDAGEVLDVDGLAAEIRALWDREGFRERQVAIGIANQRCVTRIVDLPRIRKKSELAKAIGFEVGDTLPIPMEDAIWDFHTLETFKDPTTGIERQRHLVVMTYRESVERFRDAVVLAGLKLRRIDHAGFALMRSGLPALKAVGDQADGAAPLMDSVALCDIGATSTNLVVARNGICELNRSVAFGTKHFSQTLSEQFGWSDADAERVRSEAGVTAIGGVESAGDQYADTRRVMQYVADQFASELRTSFDYYQHSSDGNHRVARVVLAGEGALLRGLEERFAAELNVPVSILDASSRLDPSSIEVLGMNHAHYGTALGLAIEEAA
jgi:type IV pilus assembly protein PilM